MVILSKRGAGPGVTQYSYTTGVGTCWIHLPSLEQVTSRCSAAGMDVIGSESLAPELENLSVDESNQTPVEVTCPALFTPQINVAIIWGMGWQKEGMKAEGVGGVGWEGRRDRRRRKREDGTNG